MEKYFYLANNDAIDKKKTMVSIYKNLSVDEAMVKYLHILTNNSFEESQFVLVQRLDDLKLDWLVLPI